MPHYIFHSKLAASVPARRFEHMKRGRFRSIQFRGVLAWCRAHVHKSFQRGIHAELTEELVCRHESNGTKLVVNVIEIDLCAVVIIALMELATFTPVDSSGN
jgi:hypothetical protein